MKKHYFAILLLLCVLRPAMGAAPGRVGAIFPEVVLRESRFAQASAKKLNDEFAPRRAAIATQVDTIRQMSAALERDLPTLDEQQKTDRRRELVDLDREIKRAQRDFQADLESRRRKEIQTVLDFVNKVVSRIARDGQYDVVLQSVVYAVPEADLTKRVIEEMDRETPQ